MSDTRHAIREIVHVDDCYQILVFVESGEPTLWPAKRTRWHNDDTGAIQYTPWEPCQGVPLTKQSARELIAALEEFL